MVSKKAMEEQHVRINTILEVLGKPKEHIEEKLKEYIGKIKEDETLMVMKEHISKAKAEGKVFTIFAELEVIVKGIENLVGFCIDYMPSSIEIIKPEMVNLDQRKFTNFVNDMLAKLHRVDMIAKQLGTENKFLKTNLHNLIKNNIMILIKGGVTETSKLASASGIDESELKNFLEMLVKENKIKEQDGKYSLQ